MVEDYQENYRTGWISIYRSIKNNWIFNNDKYFKWWVIMLFEVNHSDKKFNLGYNVMTIKKGQSSNSLRTWAVLFNSTPKTVKKFFKMLEKDGMITTEIIGKGKQSTTLVTIENYSKYQGSEETQRDTLTTTQSTTQGKRKVPTNNNDNNYNNDNKREISAHDSKAKFLKWFNSCRTEILKTPSNINTLSYNDSLNLKTLKNTYSIADFNKAMVSMCQDDWAIKHNQCFPTHFLKPENFTKYLHAKIKAPMTEGRKISGL